jgi:hypothetical protein
MNLFKLPALTLNASFVQGKVLIEMNVRLTQQPGG